MVSPTSSLQLCLDYLQDPSPWVRGPTVLLIKLLQDAQQKEFATAVIACNEGLWRLLEVVEDKREHIRDAAVQVLVKLTEHESNAKHFLAFEDGFPTVVSDNGGRRLEGRKHGRVGLFAECQQHGARQSDHAETIFRYTVLGDACSRAAFVTAHSLLWGG